MLNKKYIAIIILLLGFSSTPMSQTNSQQIYGIGAVIEKIDEGILVKNVLVKGAAFQAGINNGDIILEINGVLTKDIDLEQVLKLLRGEQNTYVNIKVKQRTNEVKIFNLKRSLIKRGIQVRIDYIFSSPTLAEKCISAYPIINDETDNISDHYPVAAEFRTDNASNLKIMTYNVLQGFIGEENRKQRFIKWIKKQNVDILALQELNNYSEISLREEALKWGHKYSTIYTTESWYSIGITSNREIKNIKKIESPTKRGVLQCEIDGTTFFVVHLHPEKNRMAPSKIQNKEANIVLTEANKYNNGKCIILGDFNALSPDDSKYYKVENLDYSIISLFINTKWIDLVDKHSNNNFMLVTCPTRLKRR
jgi:endonuclease/exonuclease/phosphatase family metal-dependent hydrolase